MNGGLVIIQKKSKINNYMERLLKLTERHKAIMDVKDIIIQVYTNASGFLWALGKLSSGTALGWSEFNGDCPDTGTFTSYENALEDAIDLIDKCDLAQFVNETQFHSFHWGNYANHLSTKYRR